MNSNKKTARIAGLWYLFMGICYAFGMGYVDKAFYVQGDAVATINNILASEWIFSFCDVRASPKTRTATRCHRAARRRSCVLQRTRSGPSDLVIGNSLGKLQQGRNHPHSLRKPGRLIARAGASWLCAPWSPTVCRFGERATLESGRIARVADPHVLLSSLFRRPQKELQRCVSSVLCGAGVPSVRSVTPCDFTIAKITPHRQQVRNVRSATNR